MTTVSEDEFSKICEQIYVDREQIYQFNNNASHNEVLLWMLLSCLISYLNLSDAQIPCFPGTPDAETYRQAILHVLKNRTNPPFNPNQSLQKLLATE